MISICLIISIKLSFFRNNELFSNVLLAVQIILYHDEFQVSNPLGNKTKKHEISAFYFVLGNISAKCGSRLPLSPLRILQNCVTPLARNSTSFLIDPWNLHMLFLQYPWKFHVLPSTPPPPSLFGFFLEWPILVQSRGFIIFVMFPKMN